MIKTEFIVVKSLVKEILSEDTRARNSDSYLYLKVLKVFEERKGINLRHIAIADFLLGMSEWGLPPFESVRRSRQQVQREFPELSANREVKAQRTENETVYREFSRVRENA